MAEPGWVSQKTAFSAYVLAIGVTYAAVNTIVPEPYMDEIFHIRQAQTYSRTWRQYDDKLTTPPGLYIPSALIARYVGSWASSASGLRAVNALLLLYLPYLLTDIISLVRTSRLRSSPQNRYPSIESLSICTFPLVYFFGFLYYTDVASLALVLWAYRQALRSSNRSSATAGLASLTLRQTNILWVAYIAFEALCLKLDDTRRPQSKRFRSTNELSSLSMLNILRAVQSFLQVSASNPSSVLQVALPYMPVAGCFVLFLFWNGGIVLGDKTMHVAVLHIPQILYFTSFTSVFLLPYICTRKVITETIRTLAGSLRRLIVTILATLGVMVLIRKYTVIHPFLLADNRHYPFYVWRRVINFNQYSRYALAPGYLTTMVALKIAISNTRTWGTLPVLAYFAVNCLALIPSPLLEFRYFIIPYIILRSHLQPVYRWQLRAETTVYIVVNLITVAVFLCRPFKWPDEPGMQRFMW